tara:strand:- start:166 stop:387 length:222 start_codon:yes stop_codon:yes gene_type:complete
MVDVIFYVCVDILVWLANLFGISYELINIIIFIILYPLFLMFLFVLAIIQNKKLKHLKNIIKSKKYPEVDIKY